MNEPSTLEKYMNAASQVAIPVFTLGGMLLVSLKYPGWGVLSLFTAQPFWFYSTYRAWRQSGQIGIFLTTIAYTVITGFGVINYFFLS